MHAIKKATAALLCVSLVGSAGLFGCGKQQPAPQPQQPQQQEQKEEAIHLAPQPAGFTPAEVKDGTLNASFTAADLKGNELTIEVFSEDLYDAVDVTRLKAGDTVEVEGKTIPVETAEDTQEGIKVNGGLGESENGVTFAPNEGGTYRVLLFDDHCTYTDLGAATFPIADNCVLKDEQLVEKGDANELETTTVEAAEIGDYLQQLDKDGRCSFNQLNTRVLVENGKIVEISRHYIP